MKRLLLPIGFLFGVLFLLPAFSSAVTVTGNAMLKNQTDHSGITVLFQRTIPSARSDSTVTDPSGAFSIDLQTGVYTVKFSKAGFFPNIFNDTSLYSSQALSPVTLVPLASRLLVPDDFSTIQSAIDASRNADTVLVSPGRYLENINFKGKNIVVGSLFLTTGDTAYVSNTIIDGNKNGHVVKFSSGEDSTAVLSGFTIMNGNVENSAYPDYYGGGILCFNSSPTLSHLIISGNSAQHGGGVSFHYSWARLGDSILRDNEADYGGGLFGETHSGTVRNVLIIKNTAYCGAGIYSDSGKYINNTICQNTNRYEYTNYGVVHFISSLPTLYNCIISSNTNAYALFVTKDSPAIQNSLFWNNSKGNYSGGNKFIGRNMTVNANGDSCDAYNNIQLDPQFIDPDHGDFRLQDTSPCIGAGTPDGAPLTDFLGVARGNPPDMGAYENSRNTPLPYIRLISPTGGEIWASGFSRDITWASFGTEQVRLEYSQDTGITWKLIASGISASIGKYAWTTPGTLSPNYLVKISDMSNGTMMDTSDAVFSVIKGGLADSGWPMYLQNSRHTGLANVSSPTSNKIKWKFQTGGNGISPSVIDENGNIYFGASDFYLYSVNPNGTLNWKFQMDYRYTVSSAISAAGVIYSMSTDSSNKAFLYAINPDGTLRWKYAFDYSPYGPGPTIGKDGTIFCAVASTLYAFDPNGTVKWKYTYSGSIYSAPAVSDDGIVYFGSNGDGFYALKPDGSLLWKYSVSQSFFSISAIGSDGTIYTNASDNSLYAFNPNGTLKWKFQNLESLYTLAIGPDGVLIAGDNGSNLFALNPDGTIKWKNSTTQAGFPLAVGSDGTIYISGGWTSFQALNSQGTPRWSVNVSDYFRYSSMNSDGTLYIGTDIGNLYAFAPYTLALTSPNGGEELVAGTQHTITWTSSAVDSVKIEYSMDNGATWSCIADSVSAAVGSFAWTVPMGESQTCRVRLSSTAIAYMTAQSADTFSIITKDLAIASPNGGETWAAGAGVDICWYSFKEATVSLDYSTDNGGSWKSIASGVASSLKKYPWVVPPVASTQCLVRITDTGDPSLTDRSDAVFTITAPANCKTVAEAADAGWIERYAYLFDGNDYVLLDPNDPADDTLIPAWSGFWVGARRNVDLLFPSLSPEPAVPADPGLDLVLEPGAWRMVAPPLDPSPGERELSGVFSSLGQYEQNWRAAKWDHAADGYQFYTGPGAGFPELLPGRGFWIFQDNSDTRNIRLNGTPVRPADKYYKLTLLTNSGRTITPYTVGNPYWYPIRWKNLLVRAPSANQNQVAKPAARAGEIEKWYVGVALEAQDGSAVDKYNRAGVVTTPGVDGGTVSALDLYPPDAYVNVRLKDPANISREGLAYDFRSSGQAEYTWEIDLSTSYSSIPTRLLLNNLANVPKDVRLVLKDPRTGQTFPLSEDYSLPVTLNAGEIRRYILTAQVGPGTATGTDERKPAVFGITEVSPNPFNPSTSITFTLEKEGNTTVRIYTANGQLAETLLQTHLRAGTHSITWNARGHASGVYLTVVESNGKRNARKITLLK